MNTPKITGDPTAVEAAMAQLADQVAAVTAPMPATAFEIPLDLIDPNPEQPRQHFDEEGLQSLAQSIKMNRVIQPIVVEISADGERYILHDGERRWRAARIAGLDTIPAYVSLPAAGDQLRRDRLTRSLVANIQREDLSPLEIARAYQNLHDLGLTDQQIADQVGKSRSTVANARRLLDLPEPAQKLADQGVSERTLAALLPLYKLPEDLLQKAEQHGWEHTRPSVLINEIRTGEIASSDLVRQRVSQIIHNHSHRLREFGFPLDHEFDADGLKVRSPRCDKCPVRIVDDDESLCPDENCIEAKAHRWRADVLSGASLVSGIPISEKTPRYNEVEHFYSDSDLTRQILADGCPNLRLKYDSYTGGGQHVEGSPNARIICLYQAGKHCICLSKLRSERTKNDPVQVAERERKKELQKMVAEYTQVLAAAIADGNPAVWLRILQAMTYKYNGKGEAWPIETIRQKMADVLIDAKLPYDSHQRIDVARRAVDKFFVELGLSQALPEPGDIAADLKRRFVRLQGWLADLDHDQVTLDAINGNLANLERLTNEFDQLAEQHSDNPEFDGFLLQIAEAWDALTELKRELQTNGRVGVQTPAEVPQ